MKFTVSRADLARALGAVTRVIEKRNTIPILGNVLLEADGAGITATGTNLDMEAGATIPAEVATPGKITVDAGRLNDIAKKAGADPVSIELVDNSLIVKSGRSKFTLPTMDPVDFPSIGHGEFTTQFRVDLAALFAPVSFAMSTEETRYYLNGVYLHVDGEELAAVATDGHRLARASVPTPVAEIPPAVVPRRLVGILPKGNVTVMLSSGKIKIFTDDLIITSKLIDGTFPDYKRVIPANNANHVSFKRADLKTAVERVATVTDGKSSAVRMNVTDAGIVLDLTSANTGSASEPVDADLDGEPVIVGFNHRYLAEILGVMTADEVKIALGDGSGPVLLTGQDNWLGVLMPMRV